MPNKGKYGTYRKHCNSCAYAIRLVDMRVVCRLENKFHFCSYHCENHVDRRSNKGKEIMAKYKINT